jgi:hypothetical protein
VRGKGRFAYGLADLATADASNHSNVCFTENLSFFPFQQWVYSAGSTTIRTVPNNFTDIEYCLDFDTNLGANGQNLKIWQCYDGLPAQSLYVTNDNHIAVENGAQCVDVRAESSPVPTRPYGLRKEVQSWQCSGGNPNQVRDIVAVLEAQLIQFSLRMSF